MAYLALAEARGLPLAQVVRDVVIAAQPGTAGEYVELEPEGRPWALISDSD
jgi:hypothetical protein